MNKLLIGIFGLILLGSCSKDSIDPEEKVPNDVKKQLEAYEWIPIVANSDTKNEPYHYKPADCEKDNHYSFSFGSNSQKLKLERGKEICEADTRTFELNFEGKAEQSFTYDREKKNIKFAGGDQYASYDVLVDEDYLVLTYRNNNPVVDYIPMEYHFRGKSKTEKNK